MEALHFTLLGKPKVFYNDAPLTGFISAKAEALLYYLAVTGHPHSREALATLLWGNMPDSAARKNLTKALSNLRKLVGPFLTIDHQSAAFHQNSSSWLDVTLFLKTATAPDVEQMRQAIKLYQGDFLEGFYIKEAPAFEEWLLGEQQRLRELLRQSLQQLIDKFIVSEEYSAAIDYTRRLLDLDPYREPVHRQLMILLARTGQRSAALVQYQTCRQLLADELGIEPEPETKALYHRLKAAGTPPPHNLPHPSTIFVGRDTELRKLTDLLGDPACRLLTIAGPGGIGKTRLALQVAFHYVQPEAEFDIEPLFPDGVYWVRLAPLDSAEAIIPTLADAVGFVFHTEGELEQQQLFNYLRHKRLLCVMDNFEHLLTVSEQGTREGVVVINTLLENAPDVKILTTSRNRLNVQGEHNYYLAGMDVPDWEALKNDSQLTLESTVLTKELTSYSAIQLFLQCARRVQPDFLLTADNRAQVVRICWLVQGMPLGILLAAVWVEMLSLAEIAQEISHSLDFLESDMNDLPQRQRSIRAVFDHSWALLSAKEQEIYAGMSTFRGYFSRQAAQAVTGASLKELMALVNKSLLRHAPTGQYIVHELLRQYAAKKLDRWPDEGGDDRLSPSVHNRHSAYYIDLLQQLEAKLKGPWQQSALAELKAEGENVRVAWRWAVEQRQIDRLAQAMDGLGQFYTWRGRYQEGETAFGIAVEQLATTASVSEKRVLAKLQAWQGVFSRQLGLAERAVEHLQKSLAILDSPDLAGDDLRLERAFVLLQLGETIRETDRPAARQMVEQSLALYQALDDRWGVANALASLGWLVQHLGKYHRAKQLYEKSLDMRRVLEDRWGIAGSLISLSSIALYQGYPDQAEQLVQQSIVLRQELDDQAGLARSLSKSGEALTWLGKFDQAHVPLEESRAIYKNLGLGDAAAFTEAMLGHIHIHVGHYDQARLKAQQALTFFRNIDSQRGKGYALLVMGWATLATTVGVEAQSLLAESKTIYEDIGQRDELAQVLTLQGYLAYKLGDMGQAQQYLLQSLQIASEIQAVMPLMLALPLAALLRLEGKETEQAVELYVLAWRYAFVSNSVWFEQMAGQYLAAVDLSSETIAAFREQEQAKPLELAIAEVITWFAE